MANGKTLGDAAKSQGMTERAFIAAQAQAGVTDFSADRGYGTLSNHVLMNGDKVAGSRETGVVSGEGHWNKLASELEAAGLKNEAVAAREAGASGLGYSVDLERDATEKIVTAKAEHGGTFAKDDLRTITEGHSETHLANYKRDATHIDDSSVKTLRDHISSNKDISDNYAERTYTDKKTGEKITESGYMRDGRFHSILGVAEKTTAAGGHDGTGLHDDHSQ